MDKKAFREELIKLGNQKGNLRPHLRGILAAIKNDSDLETLEFCVTNARYFAKDCRNQLNDIMRVSKRSWGKNWKSDPKSFLQKLENSLNMYTSDLARLAGVTSGAIKGTRALEDVERIANDVTSSWDTLEKHRKLTMRLVRDYQSLGEEGFLKRIKKMRYTFMEMEEYGSAKTMKRLLGI